MGQYFTSVISNNDNHHDMHASLTKILPSEIFLFRKFREEIGYMDSLIMAATLAQMSTIGKEVKLTVVGDYAFEQGVRLKNAGFSDLYEDANPTLINSDSFTELVVNVINQVQEYNKLSSEEKESHVQECLVSKYLAQFLVINHTKKQYLILNSYMKHILIQDNDEYEYNPLSLLTATEQGLGGGDADIRGDFIGSWVGDELTVHEKSWPSIDLLSMRNISDDKQFWTYHKA